MDYDQETWYTTQTWHSMSIAAIIYIRAESGKSMSIQVPNVMKQAIFLTCCQVNGHVGFTKSPTKNSTLSVYFPKFVAIKFFHLKFCSFIQLLR